SIPSTRLVAHIPGGLTLTALSSGYSTLLPNPRSLIGPRLRAVRLTPPTLNGYARRHSASFRGHPMRGKGHPGAKGRRSRLRGDGFSDGLPKFTTVKSGGASKGVFPAFGCKP